MIGFRWFLESAIPEAGPCARAPAAQILALHPESARRVTSSAAPARRIRTGQHGRYHAPGHLVIADGGEAMRGRDEGVIAVTREISERQVYLDADVLRYFMQGVLDPCRPPMERSPAPHPSVARLWVAAVGLVLYAPDHNWHLWISDTGRGELEAFDQQYEWAGWTRSLFEDVDGRPEAPTPEQVAARGHDYLAQLGIGDRHAKDMAHLAWAAMTPWIDTFITNDERLRRRARRLAVQFNDVRQLRIVDPLRAVQELDLQSGQRPRRRAPAASNPLTMSTWWIAP